MTREQKAKLLGRLEEIWEQKSYLLFFIPLTVPYIYEFSNK